MEQVWLPAGSPWQGGWPQSQRMLEGELGTSCFNPLIGQMRNLGTPRGYALSEGHPASGRWDDYKLLPSMAGRVTALIPQTLPAAPP